MSRHYAVLHIAPSASPDDIRQAYLDLVRVWHPDRFASDSRLRRLAEEKLKEINEAYRELSSPEPPPRPAASEPFAPARPFSHPVAIAGIGFWLRVLGFAAIFLTFLFATKYVYESLATPLQRAGLASNDVGRITRFFPPNPAIAIYGVDGLLPRGMERLANQVDVATVSTGSRAGASKRSMNARGSVSTWSDSGSAGGSGRGEFDVRNETDQDCAIYVIGRNSARAAVRNVVLRAHETAKIEGLEPDIYRLRVNFGRNLTLSAMKFNQSDGRDYWVGPFQFFETETAAGKRGETYTITLKLPQSP